MTAGKPGQVELQYSAEVLEGLGLVADLFAQYRGGDQSVGQALQDLCEALLPEVLPRPIGFTWETWDARRGFIPATIVAKRWTVGREGLNVESLRPSYEVDTQESGGFRQLFSASALEERIQDDAKQRGRREASERQAQEFKAEQAEREERDRRQAAAQEKHRAPLTAFVAAQRAVVGALRAGKLQATLEVGLSRVPRSLFPDGAPRGTQRWELVLRAVEAGYVPATLHGESVLQNPQTTVYFEQKVVTAAGLSFAQFLIDNGLAGA